MEEHGMHLPAKRRAETLAAIAHINLKCLIYWSEEGILPLDLDPEACTRAAKCPYPLVDLARLLRAPFEQTNLPPNPRAFAAGLNAAMLAWHVAKSYPTDCQMLLDLSPSDAAALADSTPSEIVQTAEQAAHRLFPRWAGHNSFWNSLTRHAATADEPSLEATRLCGLQLLILEKLERR